MRLQSSNKGVKNDASLSQEASNHKKGLPESHNREKKLLKKDGPHEKQNVPKSECAATKTR
jgi:hypothetical protein